MVAARSELEQDVRAWALAALSRLYPSVPVVYLRHGGPAPGLPYVVVGVVSRQLDGEPDVTITDETIPGSDPPAVVTVTCRRWMGTLRVQVIGSSETISAWDVSATLAGSLQDPAMQIYQGALGRLAVGEPSAPAQDVSLMYETTSETRVSQDYPYTYVESIRDEDVGVTTIERVIATGDLGGLTTVADSANLYP